MQKVLKREDLNLDSVFVEDFTDTSQPSVYYIQDNLEVLIIRSLGLVDDSLKFSSHGYFIRKDKTYKYHREEEEFHYVEDNFKGLYKDLMRIYKQNEKIITSYVDSLDKLEDDLYERHNLGRIMDTWFRIKRDFSKVDRYFERVIVTLKNFIQENDDTEEFHLAHYNDLLDDIGYQSSRVKGHLARMESIHNYYNLVKTDKLNKDIYLLTIISAIFLPLNLIVGFFGMNTENLFFKDHQEGTMYVIYLLLGVLVLTMFGLRIIKIIDELILKRIFRNSNFYEELRSKIKALSIQKD